MNDTPNNFNININIIKNINENNQKPTAILKPRETPLSISTLNGTGLSILSKVGFATCTLSILSPSLSFNLILIGKLINISNLSNINYGKKNTSLS